MRCALALLKLCSTALSLCCFHPQRLGLYSNQLGVINGFRRGIAHRRSSRSSEEIHRPHRTSFSPKRQTTFLAVSKDDDNNSNSNENKSPPQTSTGKDKVKNNTMPESTTATDETASADKARRVTDFFQPTAKRLKASPEKAGNEEKKQEETDKSANNATDNNSNNKKDEDDEAWKKPIHSNAKGKPGTWTVHKQFCLLRKPMKHKKEPARTKIAAFDLDGTLFEWLKQFPSQHKEVVLWNSGLPAKLRHLYDKENYKLVIISNQGGIRKAHTGKRATFFKERINWLEAAVERPIYAVCSTDKKSGYHKPLPEMWKIMKKELNNGVEADISQSFFVGDSIETEEDPQGGVDEKFAREIGLKFYEPQDFFGPSDKSKRDGGSVSGSLEVYAPPPDLRARQDLVSRAVTDLPILLLLVGVQGSGKSWFCEQLMQKATEQSNGAPLDWVHLSQDILKVREKVERAAAQALQQGKNVVIDRMHLDPTQRSHFLNLALEVDCSVHILCLHAPNREVLKRRVLERENHPGNVQGESGARMAVGNLSKLQPPKYNEGLIDLISSAQGIHVEKFAELYAAVGVQNSNLELPTSFCLSGGVSLEIGKKIQLPSITLGTMGLGRKVTSDVIQKAAHAGFTGFDTAPTYKNEDLIKASSKSFIVAKVPKRATTAEQVRDELATTLKKLGRDSVDLLLLHWPSDVMAADSMKEVWKEMEKCVEEKKVLALGVCNFNVAALRALLPLCKVKPSVNQVERHPLLPQWQLVDFCAQHGIILQAHTPLGQGKLLDHSAVTEISKTSSKSPAQVLLQWNLQQGVAVVPKSCTESHLTENMESLSLPALSLEHIQQLNSIAAPVGSNDNTNQSRRFVDPPFMKGTQPWCWSR